MCECGCGDFQPFAKMQGPGDVIYTLSTYLHVDCGCGNPAGVVVTKITPQMMADCGLPKEWIDRLPEVTFSPRGHDFFVGVIDPADLTREAIENGGDEDMAEVARDSLQGALWRTRESEAKRLAAWFTPTPPEGA